MNTMELVHFVSTGQRSPRRPVPTAAPHSHELMRPARAAMVRARQFLLSAQRSDGSWRGAQTSDASLASQLIFLQAYRGDEQSLLARQAAASILAQQSQDGGWPRVPGGPADVSTSVQAYFALKLTGLAACDERLARARAVIRQLGGADAADAITRLFLALLGQIDYDCCPVVRPEVLLLNRDCRPIFAPLALVWSHRTARQVGIERGVRELFIEHPTKWPTSSCDDFENIAVKPVARRWHVSITDSTLSTMLGFSERFGWTPWRDRALQQAESLLLQSIQPSHIGYLDFSELVWHAIALRATGFSDASPELRFCAERLDELVRVNEDSELAQLPVRSTAVSDTIIALQSLCSSGLAPDHPCAVEGVSWLRQRQRREQTRPRAFELPRFLHAACSFAGGSSLGDLLPQIHVSRDLAENAHPHDSHRSSRLHRFATVLARHLIAQQNLDGGWGVASGNPSVPDATGLVLEVLARRDFKTPLPEAQLYRARDYLVQTQRADGSWDSATGVRFVHGTSLAVRGLLAAGVAADDDAVAAGISWLIVHQHSSGGWGESASTATDGNRDEFVAGPATASQTAWALLALIAAGQSSTEAVRRGVHFLLETQDEDGGWREVPFVHYDTISNCWFRSDLRSVADPLMALSRWGVAAAAIVARETERVPLRLVGAMADD